jgi:hypothetical protein
MLLLRSRRWFVWLAAAGERGAARGRLEGAERLARAAALSVEAHTRRPAVITEL